MLLLEGLVSVVNGARGIGEACNLEQFADVLIFVAFATFFIELEHFCHRLPLLP